jgi:hypothetical protein
MISARQKDLPSTVESYNPGYASQFSNPKSVLELGDWHLYSSEQLDELDGISRPPSSSGARSPVLLSDVGNRTTDIDMFEAGNHSAADQSFGEPSSLETSAVGGDGTGMRQHSVLSTFFGKNSFSLESANAVEEFFLGGDDSQLAVLDEEEPTHVTTVSGYMDMQGTETETCLDQPFEDEEEDE